MPRKQRVHAPVVRYIADLTPEPTSRNPSVTKWQMINNFEGGSHIAGVSIAAHPQGEGCERHTHRGAFELFVVRAGEGVITVGDESYKVKAGDTVHVPPGVLHSVTGTSVLPLLVLCILSRAPGHEADTKPWEPVTH